MEQEGTRARRWIRVLWSTPEERQAHREALFFYLTVLGVLAAMSAYALRASPALRSPARLAAFAVLMLAHAFLHWRSPLIALRPALAAPHLVAQGALVVGLMAVAANPGLGLGLFPALIGVSAGTVRDKRLGVTAALVYLALGLWTLSWSLGWRELSFSAVMIAGAGLFAVAFALAYRRQVDAREEVQSLLGELRVAHARLAEHAQRIEDLTRGAERQRMARELHDTLAQGLAGLILLIEAAADHLRDQRTSRASEVLDHALVRARQTLAEARQAIGDLREPAADEDVEAAIRGEAERFTRASGVPCDLDVAALAAVSGEPGRQVGGIVAEALNNVARHACARRVTLSASHEDGQVALLIQDDGIGFDVEAEEARAGRYGLVGMRERARLAGGTLSIEAAPGRGTRVCLRLPRRGE